MSRRPVPTDIRSLVYFGTPDVAVPPLRALHDAGFEIGLVITGADKRRGRGNELSPTPVKEAALELGLPVAHDVDACLDVDADLGVVVAYGRIIAAPVLDRLPMVNLHFSLLPRWRGAAPVERAILAGDETTGVCLMALADELDAGDVYRRESVPVRPDVTLDGLRDELVDLGSAMLVDALRSGLGEPTPQDGEVVYAHKITTADREIDWSRPAEVVRRVVAIGGAHTELRGERFKIWDARSTDRPAGDAEAGTIVLDDGRVFAATGTRLLELVTVQAAGKPKQAARDWANGARLDDGEAFGR